MRENQLSFSARVKEELVRVQSRQDCCRMAELAALWHFSRGTRDVSLRGQDVLLTTESAALMRKAYSLAKEGGLKVRVARDKQKSSRRPHIYYLVNLEPEGEKILEERERSLHPCCRAAYLRGAFLAAGSVANPELAHHLELVVEARDLRFLRGLLRAMDLQPGVNRRNRGLALYFKDSQQIIKILSLMGAHAAVLTYENVLVYKNMRNHVNRLVNCETANLSKAIEAGMRQVENIRFLEDRIGLANLPQALREVAELRLRYPEATLKELGEMLSPRVGKSGVNHRLRRLEALAENLKAEGNTDASAPEFPSRKY
ncbi:DNA-binding protein WhiA [Thermanaeromonas sp. C210]|uniref:DNA-binding protein WhiA n=1 Tax=Thermanaeromonas sp. C210 TaxID=2731925 RepID=UPI00155BB015|nr:DNA-binding protein WhiA [Thermanaeromonas sp. C210]GFN22725.1 putative sporulation transcription regulator WhiA [Thermanaeromonas sp. C210]